MSTPGKNAQMLRQQSGGGLHRPRLVDRADLLSTLDRAAAGRVTIIAAPAGSGKTPGHLAALPAMTKRPSRRRSSTWRKRCCIRDLRFGHGAGRPNRGGLDRSVGA